VNKGGYQVRLVCKNVKIGKNTTIEESAIIYDNVEIGDDCFIGAQCILGEPLASFYKDPNYVNPPLKIGKGSIIRSGTIIYAGSTFGEGFETGHRAVIREYSEFGVHCSVGTLSDIQGFVKVGNYCRLHSNVFVAQKTVIKDYARIYVHALLLDDNHPPSEDLQGPTIEEYAIICAGAIIMPAIKVRAGSLVASGALVDEDVLPNTVVAGVPATYLCSTYDIRSKDGTSLYPWKDRFSRGYPWEAK